MHRVPLPALVLGFSGLIPFVIGALMTLVPAGTIPVFGLFPSTPEGGVALLERYGTIILAFMAGCLWGFASRHGRKPSWIELALTVVVPVAVFLLLGDDPGRNCSLLAFAFALLLGLDAWFARQVIVVYWWMHLRIPLTIVVTLCLFIGASA